jgi:hypothetical protein
VLLSRSYAAAESHSVNESGESCHDEPPKSVSEKYSAQPAGILLLFVTHFMTEAPAKKTKQTKN